MTVGEALAEARYRAGLTVDEVSERTRIREAVIRCIEQDDYEACGGDLYVRGYVRAIAGAVGIDAQPLIRDYDAARAAVPEGARGAPAGQSAVVAPPSAVRQENGSSDPAVTMFDLPAVPARPDVTIADPGFPAIGAGNPAIGAGNPAIGAGNPAVDQSHPATDPGFPAIDPDFPPIDPGFTTADPRISAFDRAFSGGDWAFAAADPGFVTAADPGFTTAEWQYSVADQGLSVDPAFGTADQDQGQGQGFATSHDFAAARPMFAGADTTAARDDALFVTPEQLLPAPKPASGQPREQSPWRRRIRGRRWFTGIAVLVVIALAAVGLAGSHIISSLRHSPAANAAAGKGQQAASQPGTGAKPVKSTPPAKPTPSATPAPPVAPVRSLRIALAEAFGPEGAADGDNPQSAPFAITRDSASPWQTDWYTTANFGLLKHGTGLLLDMGKAVTIASVRIDLSAYRGANLQLRTGRTAVLGDLRVVRSVSDVGGTIRLVLASPVRARFLLIWFTLLPPNGTGKYQENVYRVVVNGRP